MKLNKAFISILSVAFFLLMVSSTVWANPSQKWNFDRAHSSLNFSINHFFTPVDGRFDDFNVELNFDPENLDNSSIDVVIQVASINTGNEKRDGHLQTADFFDAEKFPTITFKSNKITASGDNNFVAKGILKVKDVAREIELPFKLLGIKDLPEQMQKMFGGITHVAGFESSYTLNRNDYTVGTGSWAATLVVGDEVNLRIKIEVNHK